MSEIRGTARFGILGPIQVRTEVGEVTVTAARDRIVLATLLLHPGDHVTVQRLIDAIWEDQPPRQARNQVQGCISRLRKQLAAVGLPAEIVVADQSGYQMQIKPDQVDLYEFRNGVADARSAVASGRRDDAADLYRAALGRWRGSALAGIESPQLRHTAVALEEERVRALEECIEVELALGRAGELVAELTELVHQHPYREGLHGALMLALYRAGRQADALTAYRHARQLLHDELGTEPGPELQRIHQAILNRDPDLAVSQPPARSQPPPVATPRELPADVAGFTGRAEALRALDELLPADAESAPVVLSAIAGTAGVGKTALAIHWAHRVAHRFTDGQLYVNLRGYDPDQPMSPADALAGFLAALGVSGQDIPLELDQRAARYRSEVAGRRMLIVLDNAARVDQVRPLLPGSGSCTVVVTSRDSLAGLVAVDGARRLNLDLLSRDEAIALLARLIGARAEAEPEAIAILADQCVRLPLALRVAAELAVSRPTLSLSELVAELSDEQRRLELLDAGGDPHAAVRVVFSWSIQHLPPDTARTFRLLGLHPGPDFDAYAATALTDTGLDEAHRGLELLARIHLVRRISPGRYGMHDLLRAYANQLVAIHDTDEERCAALNRLFDYYLGTAAAAMDTLHPAEAHRRPRPPPPTVLPPTAVDANTARKWLDTERPCLVMTAAYTATNGWPGYAHAAVADVVSIPGRRPLH